MDSSLRILVIAVVVLMVAVNLFFRSRIFRAMRSLAKNKVEIRSSDLLDGKRRRELMERYPDQAAEIDRLAGSMRRSLLLSFLLILCLLIAVFILNR